MHALPHPPPPPRHPTHTAEAGYTRAAVPASGACRQSAAPHRAEVQGLLADLFEENDVCLLINGL